MRKLAFAAAIGICVVSPVLAETVMTPAAVAAPASAFENPKVIISLVALMLLALAAARA